MCQFAKAFFGHFYTLLRRTRKTAYPSRFATDKPFRCSFKTLRAMHLALMDPFHKRIAAPHHAHCSAHAHQNEENGGPAAVIGDNAETVGADRAAEIAKAVQNTGKQSRIELFPHEHGKDAGDQAV